MEMWGPHGPSYLVLVQLHVRILEECGQLRVCINRVRTDPTQVDECR